MRAGNKVWSFWATALWVVAALALKDYLIPKFEHFVLDGTAVGHAIEAYFALGALNTALVWLVPVLLLLAAVRMKRLPVRSYFAWIGASPRSVLLALAAGAAFQGLTYVLAYLVCADLTSDAIAQYRSAQTAGNPVWLPLLFAWPSFIAAPLVEESIFRGFLWRGWEVSRLGARATLLLSSLVFAAYHIEKVIGGSPLQAGIVLFETFLMGLLFGWLRWRSGSTLPGMAAHFANNVIPPVATFLIGAMLAGR